MRIALASCTDLPEWEVDDAPLHAALNGRGVDVVQPAWDDAAFEWSTCDACLIRTTWDYHRKREAFVMWAERVGNEIPLFNPAAIVRHNTHKAYLRDLARVGVPVLETCWLAAGTMPDLNGVIDGHAWRNRTDRAILKPAVGATASDTLRFALDEAGLTSAAEHLARHLQAVDFQLQPYMPSVETFGEVSAVFIDGQFSHGVRKVPVSGDYRVQDDFGAHDEAYSFNGPERDRVEGIIDVAGRDLLYARVDLLRDHDDELQLSELELVEPSLFFRHNPGAADRLADALLTRLRCR